VGKEAQATCPSLVGELVAQWWAHCRFAHPAPRPTGKSSSDLQN
jgi:hypothetical protein